MNVAGSAAWSSVSTLGVGALASRRARRSSLTICSSLIAGSSRRRISDAMRTAGCPGGSMVARSHPDPFTWSTSTVSPKIVVAFAFTLVLPPPWRTSAGSAPRRRALYVRRASSSLTSGFRPSTALAASASFQRLFIVPRS